MCCLSRENTTSVFLTQVRRELMGFISARPGIRLKKGLVHMYLHNVSCDLKTTCHYQTSSMRLNILTVLAMLRTGPHASQEVLYVL